MGLVSKFALLVAASAIGSVSAHARPVNEFIGCNNLPRSWQPLLSFYQFATVKESGRMVRRPVYSPGTLFVEIDSGDEPGDARMRQIIVAYPKGSCQYHIEHKIDLRELQYDGRGRRNRDGYVIKEKEGRKLFTLIAPDVGERGGFVRIRVLKEANWPWSDDYKDGLTFNVSLESVMLPKGQALWGIPTARLSSGSHPMFNLMEVEVRMKSFPTRGTIPAGIKRVAFCKDNCDTAKLHGYDYVP